MGNQSRDYNKVVPNTIFISNFSGKFWPRPKDYIQKKYNCWEPRTQPHREILTSKKSALEISTAEETQPLETLASLTNDSAPFFSPIRPLHT